MDYLAICERCPGNLRLPGDLWGDDGGGVLETPEKRARRGVVRF